MQALRDKNNGVVSVCIASVQVGLQFTGEHDLLQPLAFLSRLNTIRTRLLQRPGAAFSVAHGFPATVFDP
ncbi:hypothetical protein ABZ260_22100 [Streptosporangium sp. NPDC006013]|uniref:hypothetical protein n=1 Tax=Streptosporangium sp. NPDC006013 TaxID=3155596 RepID=UPI0033AB4EA4